MTEVKKTSLIVSSLEPSINAMMSYIVDYGSRVLTGNKQKERNILDLLFYEEKQSLSESGQGEDQCVHIHLNEIKDKEKIRAIYTIIRKIVESLKEINTS